MEGEPEPRDDVEFVEDSEEFEEAEREAALREAEARRLSPYALASFVVSLLIYFAFTGGLVWLPVAFLNEPMELRQWIQLGAAVAVPSALAVVAIWLSWKAEDELGLAGGALGGSAFATTGRLLGGLAIGFVVLSVLLTLLFQESRPGGFGGF